MYKLSALKASLDTSDCLARRADASPYFAMREGMWVYVPSFVDLP
jgi:hypothetical protein